MADVSLINQLIKDSSNKELINDGVFTLGELHADRTCLFINLIEFLSKIYSLTGDGVEFWHSDSKHEGYSHFGVSLNNEDLEREIMIGGIFSDVLLSRFNLLNSVHLPTPKKYKPLNETLKLFNY